MAQILRRQRAKARRQTIDEFNEQLAAAGLLPQSVAASGGGVVRAESGPGPPIARAADVVVVSEHKQSQQARLGGVGMQQALLHHVNADLRGGRGRGRGGGGSGLKSAAERPPTATQVAILRKRGLKDEYMPSSREEASLFLKMLIHSRKAPALESDGSRLQAARMQRGDEDAGSTLIRGDEGREYLPSHQLSQATLAAIEEVSALTQQGGRKDKVQTTRGGAMKAEPIPFSKARSGLRASFRGSRRSAVEDFLDARDANSRAPPPVALSELSREAVQEFIDSRSRAASGGAPLHGGDDDSDTPDEKEVAGLRYAQGRGVKGGEAHQLGDLTLRAIREVSGRSYS